MRNGGLFGLIVFLFIWSVCLSVTFAQTKENVESLQGLPGVRVVVESISQEAERDALTKIRLKVVAELELRKAGIKVLTKKEWLSNPSCPWLYINVNANKHSSGLYACYVSIKLIQKVILLGNQSVMMPASTWSTGTLGIGGRAGLSAMEETVKYHVDEFINDYLTANPK